MPQSSFYISFRLESRDLECPACGSEPFTRKSLDRHLERFECPAQFACNMCVMKFKNKSLLKNHKDVEH